LFLEVVDGLAVRLGLLAQEVGDVEGTLQAIVAICPLDDVLEMQGAA